MSLSGTFAFDNSATGTLEAAGAAGDVGTLSIDRAITNDGSVLASAFGLIAINEPVTGSGSYLADLGTINILADITENPPGSNVGLTALGGIINLGQGLMQVSVDGCGPIIIVPKGDPMGNMAGSISVNDSMLLNASNWDIGDGQIGANLFAILALVNNSTGTVNGPVTVHQNGTLNIDNSSLTATDLILEDGASLAVASSITLSGSLSHDSTDGTSTAWSWGAGSTLTLTGGQAANTGPCTLDGWALLEAASEDTGPTGGDEDFEFADLVLAAGAHVSLVNLDDNHAPAVNEAVYCDNLTLGTGAVLNLNSLNLYVGGVVATAGPFDNGMIEDEPRIPLVGDFNDDGTLDTDDIAGFVNVLLGLDTNSTSICNADLNGDTVADGLDIQVFILTIAGS